MEEPCRTTLSRPCCCGITEVRPRHPTSWKKPLWPRFVCRQPNSTMSSRLPEIYASAPSTGAKPSVLSPSQLLASARSVLAWMACVKSNLRCSVRILRNRPTPDLRTVDIQQQVFYVVEPSSLVHQKGYPT